MFSDKWHKRFLELAEFVAQWSKDPSTQTGAVIVRPNKTIASVGYNGFPRAIEDRKELLNDREKKYPRIIHAEMNAILNSAVRTDGYILFNWPGQCCINCAKHVIQAGIAIVVCPKYPEKGFTSRWGEEGKISEQLFREAGVEVVKFGRRKDG